MSRLGDALGSLFGATEKVVHITHVEEAAQVDRDDHLYRSVNAGLRDLTGNVLRRAQDMSVDVYRRNPLANRIIKIYTSFMAGEGFAISCDNPDVQAIADDFWYAERNEMDINHRRFARDFLLYGEAPHPVAADETGNTTVGYIDPQAIDHVEASTLNRLILERVVLLRSVSNEPDGLQIVRRQDDPALDELGLLQGDIFLWLNDRIGAATRGTPFLLPVLDWLDAYDQILWELLERIKATRAFFWDVAVEGGQTEVDEAKAIWGTTAPRTGSTRFRTKSMEVSATQPDIGAHEDVAAARYILRHIATGAGLAPHWLADPEDANRSTAEQMDVPVFRSLTDIQAVWKANMEELLRFAIDRKIAAGMLPAIVERHTEDGQPTGDMVPAGDLVEVVVPSITDDGIEGAAAALAGVATAFVQLDMIDVVDRTTLRKVVRHILPALGIPADELPDPEDEDLDEEERDAQMIDALEAIQRRAADSGAYEEILERL